MTILLLLVLQAGFLMSEISGMPLEEDSSRNVATLGDSHLRRVMNVETDSEIEGQSGEEEEAPSSFSAAFISSISMILVSELGDKTFFIAAIMAMRHQRLVVFSGAFGALVVMTLLSAAMGMTLPNLLPRASVRWASTLLFFVFGVRLLRDGYNMDSEEENEELEEVEQELEKKSKQSLDIDLEKDKKNTSFLASLQQFFSSVFWQSWTMTFLAEWGDRSQIATIAMAAASDPYGVTLGAIIGHGLCTGLAVLGGRVLATRISERTVTLVGGTLFLIFAIHSVFFA